MRGEGFRNVTAPAIGIALSPYAASLALHAGPAVVAACRVAPEILPKALEGCRNPLLAATLGAAICGSTAGTIRGSAREYERTRERLQEIREASERVGRFNAQRQNFR
jgi:hypothetical protein